MFKILDRPNYHKLNATIKKSRYRPTIREWKVWELNPLPDIKHDLLPENEAILGWDVNDPNLLSTIPFNPKKRLTMVIQGDADSGKSTLCKWFCTQLNLRWKRPLAIFDPKRDWRTLLLKNTHQPHIQELERIGLKPKAYDKMCFISPEAIKIMDAQGKPYGISPKQISDLIQFNPILGTELVYKLWDTSSGEPVARALQRIFYEKKPQSMKELINLIENYSKIFDVSNTPPTLAAQFFLLQMQKILSDNSVNIPQLLAENKILDLELQISSEKENTIQDFFVFAAINDLIADRTVSVSSSNKQGYNHVPVTLIIEEGNVFAAPNRLTTEQLTMITTKYREINPLKASEGINTYGFDFIIVCQHISDLEQRIVEEADWIVTPRVSSDEDIQLLKLRGLDPFDIYELQNLEYSINKYPKTFKAIPKLKRNGIRTFKPLPPLTFVPIQS